MAFVTFKVGVGACVRTGSDKAFRLLAHQVITAVLFKLGYVFRRHYVYAADAVIERGDTVDIEREICLDRHVVKQTGHRIDRVSAA